MWQHLDETREKHVANCTAFVNSKIEHYHRNWYNLQSDLHCYKAALDLVINHAQTNLESLLSSRIKDLLTLHNNISSTLTNYTNMYKDILKIFNYGEFSDPGIPDVYTGIGKMWSAYQLMQEIGLITCPYCNETSVYTIYDEKKGKMRAEFDHFLPKSQYPLFALSFYNLIPSCHYCNHKKRDSAGSINPHDDYFSSDDYFHIKGGYIPTIDIDPSKIEIAFTSKSDNSAIKRKQVEDLLILERYNCKKQIIHDVIKKKQMYCKENIKQLKGIFDGVGISEQDIFRLVYNVEQDEKDYHKYPLSKLINDIIR